jgi:opacity protein-like surface antigen
VVIKHQPEVAFLSTSETSILADYKSGLQSVEFNLNWYPNERIRTFIGGRYMKLDEELRISTESFGTTYLDEVSTKNDLLGGQLGIEGVLFGKTDDGFSIEGGVKVGYFHNDISVKAEFPLPVLGDLSARSSKDENTLAGEFGIGVSYAFLRNIALSARYQLLWLNHVALAPEQWPVTDYATGRINTATDSVIYHGAWVGVILSW